MKLIEPLFKPHIDIGQIKWNIGGLFIHDGLLRQFIEFMMCHFAITPFDQVYGSPPNSLWNGGRVLGEPQHTISEVQYLKNVYHTYNVNINLTLSNHNITTNDLSDPYCNFLLNEFHSTDNYVTISSPILHEYIRNNYPKYKIKCSLIHSCVNKLKTIDDYKKLQDEWEMIILPPDIGFNVELVSNLDVSRVEILVNEYCIKDCANRTEHYELLSLIQKGDIHPNAEHEMHLRGKCLSSDFDLIKHRGTCHLTSDIFDQLYECGVRNFKLQGRKDFIERVIISYLYFTMPVENMIMLFPYTVYHPRLQPFDILKRQVQ